MAKQTKPTTATTNQEPTPATTVNEPSAPTTHPWQTLAAAALFVLGLLAAAVPLASQPGYELSFPVTPMIRLWLLMGLIGALLSAVGPKAAAPVWLEDWSNEDKRSEIIGRYALQGILLRVIVVFGASQFFGIPLHPLHSLSLGAALFSVEVLYEALAYTLFQRKPTHGRRYVWGAVALFVLIGVIDAHLAGLLPLSHWFATIVHIFTAPVWYLVPTAPAFLSLANGAIGGSALVWFFPFVLFAAAALALLYKPKQLALGLSAALAASLIGIVPSLQEGPDEQEARAGALAARQSPQGWSSRRAPELRVSSFTGEAPPQLADYGGKVKVLYFFQSF